jgi:hypothetical protein
MVVRRVLAVTEQARDRPPVTQATRTQVGPVAPATVGPVVPVLAVPRAVVTVVPHLAVRRVQRRAAPGPAVLVQAMPQGALAADLAVLGAAALVVMRRPRPPRAVRGTARRRAVEPRRAVLAVLVVPRPPETVVPGPAVSVVRVRAVTELAAQALPAVMPPVVRAVPRRAVRVVLAIPRAVPRRAVPAVPVVGRAVPQRRVPRPWLAALGQAGQQQVVQAVPRRRAAVTRLAARPEPPRPPVGQAQAVGPVVTLLPPMALPPMAVPRPETARLGQQVRRAEQVAPVQRAAPVEPVEPVEPADRVEQVEWVMARPAVRVERVAPRPSGRRRGMP